MQIRRAFALCVTLTLACTAVPLLAQRNNDNRRPEQQRVDPDAQALADFIDLTLVNDPLVTSGTATADDNVVTLNPNSAPAPTPPPNEVNITWQGHHFMKGQDGQTYVPFALNVDRANLPSKNAVLFVRVLNAEQAKAFGEAVAAMQKAAADDRQQQPVVTPIYAWNSASNLELPDGPLQRAMLLSPGKYVAFIAIKERTAAPANGNQRNRRGDRNERNNAAATPGKMGLLRHEIEVPDFERADLATSSVILASDVQPTQPLSPAEQEANPYVFGPMRIVPSLDGSFSKNGNLNVIFWIYGAADAGGGKPDVTLDFSFHQNLAEGEKYFNRTQPQIVNASTLPAEFSVAAGHQLPGSLEVPLSSFPAGDYRLEIKVTDKVSGKTLTENVKFTVLPV